MQVEDTLKQVYYDTQIGMSMGDTAELLAHKYAITREMSDQYAVCTQQRWEKGIMGIGHRLSEHMRPVPCYSASTGGLNYEYKQSQVLVTVSASACKAHAEGRLEVELAPVSFVTADGSRVELAADEHPRPDTNLETIARLQPVFRPAGIVTAANASVRTFAKPHCTYHRLYLPCILKISCTLVYNLRVHVLLALSRLYQIITTLRVHYISVNLLLW